MSYWAKSAIKRCRLCHLFTCIQLVCLTRSLFHTCNKWLVQFFRLLSSPHGNNMLFHITLESLEFHLLNIVSPITNNHPHCLSTVA